MSYREEIPQFAAGAPFRALALERGLDEACPTAWACMGPAHMVSISTLRIYENIYTSICTMYIHTYVLTHVYTHTLDHR